MTMLIGNLALCLTALTAVVVLLLSLRAARTGSPLLFRAAPRGIHVMTGLLTLACGSLLFALLNNDFRIQYVQHYTERVAPLGYKIAAFWAGQQGSVLLWAWLLAVMASLFVLLNRTRGTETVIAAGVLALVIGFFAVLMLFAANPFEAAEQVAVDGHGLNPMLQDPQMIAHPPVLFVGYAGFTIPFALLVGVLVSHRKDSDWLAQARPWVLVSWIFLGAGILLGAHWAYSVLGWGGYWAWDPVENASLLPWLTGTALLHCMIVQRQRGLFKRWTAVLAATTFLLCIFGTYITRSGVVDSVHSFGGSLVGTFFGVFLMLTTLATIALIAFRWNLLRPERQVHTWVSREGAFLIVNILFVTMTLVTLFGTVFPAISGPVMGQPLSVSQSFYNRAVLPLVLLLLPLMALSPSISYGRDTMQKLVRALGVPLAMSGISVGLLWGLHVRSVWALASAILVTVVVGSIVVDLLRTVRARRHNSGESVLVASLKLFDTNHRRYGGHIVHAGITMIIAGIAGSSLYNTKENVPLAAGASADVGKYSIKLDSLKEGRETNYTAVRAELTIVDPNGKVEVLHPERRFYDKSEEANTQVAIRSNWREDLYVTLAGWETGGSVVTFQVIINPLVRWIWAGGLVLVTGAIWCLLPKLSGSRQSANESETPKKVGSSRVAVSRKNNKRRRPAAVGV